MKGESAECVLCSESRLDPYLTVRDPDISHESFQIVRCRSCGLLFASPRPAAADLVHYYGDAYPPYNFTVARDFLSQDSAGLWSWRNRIKRAVLRFCYGYPVSPRPSALWRPLTPLLRLLAHKLAYFPRHIANGRLLEVGCATGAYLRLLKEVGWKVRGVELHPQAAAFARDKLGLDVATGPLIDAGFPKSSFDAVVLSHVLEHLPNPAATLAEARRVLAPGGDLYVAAPNLAVLERRLFGRHWAAWEAPRHLYHFTPRTLTRLLEKHGFTVRAKRFDLFNNGLDVALSMRLTARGHGWTRLEKLLSARVIQTLYAPLGVPLSACGLGTRMLFHAQKT